MHVEGTAAGDGQQPLLEHLAVIEGEDEIGLQLAHPGDHFRGIGVLRGDHRDVVPLRQFGDAGEPEGLARVIPVGDQQGNFHPPIEQDRQAAVADVVIGEDHAPVHFPASCSG